MARSTGRPPRATTTIASRSSRPGRAQLALSRQYFTLTPVTKNGRIVYREQPFSGTLQPGDLLLVRLVAAGSKDWRYLMLEDPLPAGTEAVHDPDLYELERPPDWWYGSQREYRDNRIVQFQSDFSAAATSTSTC